MPRRSIRWRLAASFAGIALLATLTLGAVLLSILRSYYLRQERTYLEENARAIDFALTHSLDRDASPEIFQSRLGSFGFVSQSRIQVLDTDGRLVADSGPPRGRSYVSLALWPTPVAGDADSFTGATVPVTSHIAITASLQGDSANLWKDGTPGVDESDYRVISSTGIVSSTFSISAGGETPGVMVVPAVSPFFGFGQGEGARVDVPSKVRIQQPIYNANGGLLGYLVLSEGPAYGTQIVGSVARGWGAASIVAIVLAAGVGWWISRTISAPLQRLVAVTSQMAKGDLSTRAQATEREDELGTLARAFNHMADRVEETVIALRSFVSDAAHEILTPLATIRTNVELLPENDAVARAQTQVARLEALAKGLLDLSQIEGERQAERHELVALDALVQAASEPYASSAEQADIAFDLLLPARSVIVRGDEEKLRSALGNLLDNAVKFTPGGGRVNVTVRQGEGYGIVEVEDTGIGIPAEDLPYLFQRFHRGRNTAAYPGSGLGLAIVKAIVERHGGTASAESTTQGSRFTIRLPV